MCKLVLDENKYNSKESYWKAIIMNSESFTLGDLMNTKRGFSEQDLKTVIKIIGEMNDAGYIKKFNNKFFVMQNTRFIR